MEASGFRFNLTTSMGTNIFLEMECLPPSSPGVRIDRLSLLVVLVAMTGACVPAPADPVPAPAQIPSAGGMVATEPVLAMLTVQAEEVVVYSAPARSASAIDTVTWGDRLELLGRENGWSLVRSTRGARGWVETASLVSSGCTTDRATPVIIEEPRLRFRDRGAKGMVVVEAEYSAAGELLKSRVVENTTGDPETEVVAMNDLRGLRFLPPTRECKPLPFFYTFRRQF
jgi:hypothetical protein